jgi:hypothetical protein
MPKQYLPDRQVAQRYGRHITTLARWDQSPDLGFPKPIRINNRKYREVDELDEWDRSRRNIGKAAGNPAKCNHEQ